MWPKIVLLSDLKIIKIIVLVFIIIVIVFLTSCSKIKTLNLNDHDYGVRPKKIIWLQIAGFDEEHIAMLRFHLSSKQKTSFEQFNCLGKTWNYNLFELRPRPEKGFLTQMTGKENIKNLCDGYTHKPMWNYFQKVGYSVGVFELGANKEETFEYGVTCNNINFYKELLFWKMAKTKNASSRLFHFQEEEKFSDPNFYYDKSCQAGTCFSSITSNIDSIMKRFFNDKNRYLFIIRDFSYYHALNKKKIKEARTILAELEKIVEKMLQRAKRTNEMLILVSTSSNKKFEFPKEGKEWASFEMKGSNIYYRNSSLMSSVFAYGASAENFCGIYREVEIFERMFFGDSHKKFLNFIF